ncbi:unnamed protein product [Leptosia nina]|uniref:Uncharacterized protein n=1 Tax=Leptosia nina TaxID=320188 RepID=A0AAV1JI76_9NEOP
MSDKTVQRNGGYRNIVPSARKGIHEAHNTVTMNDTRHKDHRKVQEGYDEPDNVLSKPIRHSSPITTRRLLPRRSSVDANLTESSDDEQENIHHSNCQPTNDSINSSYDGNCSSEYTQLYEHHNISTKSLKNGEKTGSTFNNCFSIILVSTCVIAMAIWLGYYPQKTYYENTYDKFDFYKDVKSLAQKYQVKQDAMLQIRTGIDQIFEKEDTGSFIFTYDGDKPGFDPVQFHTFMDNIASAASRYLRNDTQNVQHIVLDNSNVISLKSDIELINKYREDVSKRGVLLVKNVERVPSDIAMAFHYYCDEYNPLVKKSAIFFTLNVAKCSIPSTKKSAHDYVERCLKGKWQGIHKDKIGPLLTRVANIIVDVTDIY